ncbi:Eaa1 [Salmonella enterica subsp. arizonae]|uniref:Eaa1 n=1 Tax=Salmonella enterica subsp. arizonae TaxID=59203 RepID=A0A379S122_SALER|nr:Eaa1 [Salmonella enterica subsp. arizonae]
MKERGITDGLTMNQLAERNAEHVATIAALEARYAALAAENAGLKAFKTAVYQQMGAGCEAPEFSITEGLSNLRRFADTLHAIEREFFTKEVPDEECKGETVEECPLAWGMSVEQYVAEFRKCLAEVRESARNEASTMPPADSLPHSITDSLTSQ